MNLKTKTDLDVNKIHFILANINIDEKIFIKDIYNLLDINREKYKLSSNQYYYNKLATPSRFDSKNIIFIKRLLQNELNHNLRKNIVNQLFKKYITTDESAFSNQLYMTTNQLKIMCDNGMHIGSHGYDHLWLKEVNKKKQTSR